MVYNQKVELDTFARSEKQGNVFVKETCDFLNKKVFIVFGYINYRNSGYLKSERVCFFLYTRKINPVICIKIEKSTVSIGKI